jgi:nucleoside-diphosphate-sugar epimerase
VRILVRRPPKEAIDPRIEVVLGDLGDADAVDRVIRGATSCITWAPHTRRPRPPARHHRRRGTIDAYEAQRPRLVYVSSLSMHNAALPAGPSTRRPRSSRGPRARALHQAARGGRLVMDAVRERGLRHLRVPGDPRRGRAAGALCGGIGAATDQVMLGDGEMTLPLVHVEDVVGALPSRRSGAADGPSSRGRPFVVLASSPARSAPRAASA